MAVSFITLTGRLNAASESNPTHPFPRLCGSKTGRLQDRPVPVTTGGSELPLKVAPEITLDAVIVEEGVVHVHEEHQGVRDHDAAPVTPLASASPTRPRRCERFVRSRSA